MARQPQKQSIAAALDLSRARVSQLIKLGMPTETIEQAREWYQANVRVRTTLDDSDQPPRARPIVDAKAREIEANAALKELDLARRIGTITDKAGVERAAYQFGRILQKTLIDVLPAKVSMELATMTDPWAIECYLRDKLRGELTAVSQLTTEEAQQHAA